MPIAFLSAIKELYDGDEYILLDGEKRARVKPSKGVKQGCPLSPLLFSLYINDIDSLADGIIDYGQPTYVGYNRDKHSRPDHILLSPALYGLVGRVCIKEVGHFDHRILSMVFVVNSSGLQHTGTNLDDRYSYKQADSSSTKLRLHWRPHRALAYSAHIQSNHNMKERFESAVEQGDVEGANQRVKEIVLQAAKDPRVGITASFKNGNARINRRGMKRPVWFDWDCQARRQAFIAAVRSGEARHACKQMYKINRSHARWARRRFTSHLGGYSNLIVLTCLVCVAWLRLLKAV